MHSTRQKKPATGRALSALCGSLLFVLGLSLIPASASAQVATATTGEATVHGNEATLMANLNDEGSPGMTRFEWRELLVGESLESVFSTRTTNDSSTPAQAIAGSPEAQDISATIGPLSVTSEYAYRVVLAVGSEEVAGNTREFSMPGIKDSPSERFEHEHPMMETSPVGTGDPPAVTHCRVPSLKALSLSRARRELARDHCGHLKLIGTASTKSPNMIRSQSPRAHTVIASIAAVTVWLRKRSHTKP